MDNWGISNAIERGIENGITNIKDSVNEFFRNLIFDSCDVLLDAGATFIIILLVWCCIKAVIMINKDKRAENANMIVCLCGLYFIVRMIAKILS